MGEVQQNHNDVGYGLETQREVNQQNLEKFGDAEYVAAIKHVQAAADKLGLQFEFTAASCRLDPQTEVKKEWQPRDLGTLITRLDELYGLLVSQQFSKLKLGQLKRLIAENVTHYARLAQVNPSQIELTHLGNVTGETPSAGAGLIRL